MELSEGDLESNFDLNDGSAIAFPEEAMNSLMEATSLHHPLSADG
jgi:hypothetical protein